MKSFAKHSAAIVGAALLSGIACLLFSGQLAHSLQKAVTRFSDSEANRQLFETVVRPATDRVRWFQQTHGRLPDSTEISFNFLGRWPAFQFSIYDSQPPWLRSWGRPGVDFVMCVHAGEWNLMHQSWDDLESSAWTE